MTTYNFTPPLCLSCGVSLEHKVEVDGESGLIYEVDYCPNCEEIYKKTGCTRFQWLVTWTNYKEKSSHLKGAELLTLNNIGVMPDYFSIISVFSFI